MATATRLPGLASAEPNVTPMLDVLLVLLIIFLSVAIQVHHTIDAVFPQPCAGSCSGGESIVLEVRAGPEYRLNRQLILARELAERLSDVYRDRPEKVIQIAGHPGASYQDVVTAIDIAKQVGVRVVGIAPKSSYLAERPSR
jgi:Biopolymer transport protein